MIVKLGLIMPPYYASQTQCFQLKESDHQTMAVGTGTILWLNVYEMLVLGLKLAILEVKCRFLCLTVDVEA